MVDKRDVTEEKVFSKLDRINDQIAEIRLKIAKWEADAQYSQLISQQVGHISKRLEKNEADLNNAYERIRNISK